MTSGSQPLIRRGPHAVRSCDLTARAGACEVKMTDRGEYDYVIVGGGTAGCILAARLSEDPADQRPAARGGRQRPKLEGPHAFRLRLSVQERRSSTGATQGEPEPALDGRRIYQPRGKVLGGSSSINGLGFIRGHPLDFERWAAEGAEGWSYREVLPYFRRSETLGRRRQRLSRRRRSGACDDPALRGAALCGLPRSRP